MRKYLTVLVVFAVMTVMTTASWAQEASYYEIGDKGYFQYQWSGTPGSFVIWGNKDLRGSSLFYGEITSETKITMVNRRISRENLDLLTGKPVIAYGKFKEVGRGEGGRTFCLELTIFVLSESTYRIPIPPQK